MKTQEFPYDPARFDADYYGGGARGGFPSSYTWEHPDQQAQLEKKFQLVQRFGDYQTILFIGCAKGFEVRYFFDKGKQSWGVDVSKFAVENCDANSRDRIFHFNGWNLIRFRPQHFDVVAAFDVLTLLPDKMLDLLSVEMRRTCAKRIIFRTVIASAEDRKEPWHGNDGVTYRYLPWETWVDLFARKGFELRWSESDPRRETIFVFERKA